MAEPKYRRSHSQKRLHRAHWKLPQVKLGECPHCHEPKLPHRVCGKCGYYNGMEVLTVVKKDKKK